MDRHIYTGQPGLPQPSTGGEEGVNDLRRLKEEKSGGLVGSPSGSPSAGAVATPTAGGSQTDPTSSVWKERRQSPWLRCSGSVEFRADGSDVRMWGTLTDISLHGRYLEMNSKALRFERFEANRPNPFTTILVEQRSERERRLRLPRFWCCDARSLPKVEQELRRIRGIGLLLLVQLPSGFGDVGFVGDVVPVENAARFVTGDVHADAFLYAEPAEVSHTGAPQVVEDQADVPLLPSLPPLSARWTLPFASTAGRITICSRDSFAFCFASA